MMATKRKRFTDDDYITLLESCISGYKTDPTGFNHVDFLLENDCSLGRLGKRTAKSKDVKEVWDLVKEWSANKLTNKVCDGTIKQDGFIRWILRQNYGYYDDLEIAKIEALRAERKNTDASTQLNEIVVKKSK